MKEIFVDTSHFVATLHPSDQLHEKATTIEKSLEGLRLVSSDFVLVEVLNYFSKFPEHFKQRISAAIQLLIANSEIVIIKCSREEFIRGFQLYCVRLDHGYSLTDSVSMNIMKERGISEILSNDDNFREEGFKILL